MCFSLGAAQFQIQGGRNHSGVMHPGGRCCQALVPKDAQNYTIGGLTFRVQLEDNLPLVNGFQVFLSNRESANPFHRKKFNIDGVELKASTKELGYMLYNLKTFKEIFLDTNEKFNCKNYKTGGEYSKCLESTYLGTKLFINFVFEAFFYHFQIKC